MDVSIKHPCGSAQCGVLLPRGTRYCEVHARIAQQRDVATRGTAAQRGYDAAWRHATKDYLASHPWCARCERESRKSPSALVGHIKSIRDYPGLRLEPSNWEPLCVSCNAKQSHEEKSPCEIILPREEKAEIRFLPENERWFA